MVVVPNYESPTNFQPISDDLVMGYIDLVVASWSSFKRDPGDDKKFKDLDWTINVAHAKWQTYAENRKASGT